MKEIKLFWEKGFYDHRGRWQHYYHQINAVREFQRSLGGENIKVLEVGPNIGTITQYLKSNGIEVTTLDIFEEWKPDVLGSILNIPLPDNTFDFALACEIFEHERFEDFTKALKELHRVTKGRVFISIPDHRHILFKMSLKLPFLKEIKVCIRSNRLEYDRTSKGKSDGHYWEMGYRKYPVSKIEKAIKDSGFRIVKKTEDFHSTKSMYYLLECCR